MNGFLIAGTNSGCGKTTITIGLMALLKSLGKQVAPFKTGPDYIDPLFHSLVLDTPSYNLDSFLLSHNTIKHLFAKHTAERDIAVVEGVMGMYDGLGEEMQGSSYELSQLLDLPVVLVLSCKSLYQSVAAIVKGFAELKPNANIKGVILNHVPNDEYYQFLKGIIERETQVSCLGYVPNKKEFALESRHLGLVQAQEVGHLPQIVNQLVETLASTIDVEQLLSISELEDKPAPEISLPSLDLSDLHIAVAHDKAFSFYYQDNLELLEELGAKLSFFSPLKDKTLPEAYDGLYLGGGYPEVFAEELLQNEALRNNIKEAIEAGAPVYAECGGLMYLCDKIIDQDGKSTDMVGVYNASVQMTERLQRFGYANLNYAGAQTNCHEFHRSKLIENETEANYQHQYHLTKPAKQREWTCGLAYKNSLAGYAHVHFYSNYQFLEKIVNLWRAKTTST